MVDIVVCIVYVVSAFFLFFILGVDIYFPLGLFGLFLLIVALVMEIIDRERALKNRIKGRFLISELTPQDDGVIREIEKMRISIPIKLVKLRREAELSLDDVARKSGLSVSEVINLESTFSNHPFELIWLYLQAFEKEQVEKYFPCIFKWFTTERR